MMPLVMPGSMKVEDSAMVPTPGKVALPVRVTLLVTVSLPPDKLGVTGDDWSMLAVVVTTAGAVTVMADGSAAGVAVTELSAAGTPATDRSTADA